MEKRSVKEAAEILGVSRMTIYRMIDRGNFPHCNRAEKPLSIPQIDIDILVHQTDTTPPEPEPGQAPAESTQELHQEPEREEETRAPVHLLEPEPHQEPAPELSPPQREIKHHFFLNLGFFKWEYFSYTDKTKFKRVQLAALQAGIFTTGVVGRFLLKITNRLEQRKALVEGKPDDNPPS